MIAGVSPRLIHNNKSMFFLVLLLFFCRSDIKKLLHYLYHLNKNKI